MKTSLNTTNFIVLFLVHWLIPIVTLIFYLLVKEELKIKFVVITINAVFRVLVILWNILKLKGWNINLKTASKSFFVFTIKNPCNKEDFPNRVNKDYFCVGEKINNKQVYDLNGRIVIGLLHNGKSCRKDEIDFVKSHQITGRFCELRNNTPIENLNAGMGDIFIKLARSNLWIIRFLSGQV